MAWFRWYLQWNEHLEAYDNLLRKNLLKDKDREPDIQPFRFYIDAFFELNTCRSGMGDGPISFTAIVEYAKIYIIEEFDEFVSIIRMMDNEYLKHQRKKNAPK